MRNLKYCVFVLSVVLSGNAMAEESPPAFPGAEGFGAFSKGGRGGSVCFVTNLEDYHPGSPAREAITRNETGEIILPAQPAKEREKTIPGSLRSALEMSGPVTIIFRVGGTIELKAPLAIQNASVTLAGQTAPGGGICLKNYGLIIRNTHDVIVRYIRVRPGDLTRTSQDAICLVGSRNVIVDHCSTSWGVDENLSVSGEGTSEATVQWCIISESLNDSWHPKGPHGMGSLIRTNGTVSYHHNLYAHNNNRNPRPGTYGDPPVRFDFRNNVIYNWGIAPGYSAEDPVIMNYVSNYLQTGPSLKTRPTVAFHIGGESTQIYAEGNHLVSGGTIVEEDWEMIRNEKLDNILKEPFHVPNTHTDTAQEAFDKVLASAGASLPTRDPVDLRVIADVKSGEGRVIDSQMEVGGWPSLDPGMPPEDTDNDGLPDKWERDHGLDPENPEDQRLDRDGDGYTNLEEYLNALVRKPFETER